MRQMTHLPGRRLNGTYLPPPHFPFCSLTNNTILFDGLRWWRERDQGRINRPTHSDGRLETPSPTPLRQRYCRCVPSEMVCTPSLFFYFFPFPLARTKKNLPFSTNSVTPSTSRLFAGHSSPLTLTCSTMGAGSGSSLEERKRRVLSARQSTWQCI